MRLEQARSILDFAVREAPSGLAGEDDEALAVRAIGHAGLETGTR